MTASPPASSHTAPAIPAPATPAGPRLRKSSCLLPGIPAESREPHRGLVGLAQVPTCFHLAKMGLGGQEAGAGDGQAGA